MNIVFSLISEHEKISLILSGAAQPLNENHKALIYQCGVDICDNLNVRDILPNLVSKDIISPADSQTLEAALDVHGNFDAAFRLLLLLPNKKPDWYVCFRETLRGDKQEDLADRINRGKVVKCIQEITIVTVKIMKKDFNPFPHNVHFDALNIYSCGKHCEKRRNCLLQAISPFLTMFSTLYGTYFLI